MDVFQNPPEVLSLTSLILLLLFGVHRSLQLSIVEDTSDESSEDMVMDTDFNDASALHVNGMMHAAVQHMALWATMTTVDEDLGFWVKPRSTTWFSRFLLQEYDDERWVQMFRMTKRAVLSLAQLLQPHIQKRDTRYRLAIPVIVRVACSLFKLSHGASMLLCSEMFAVGRSTLSVMLREVVEAINVVLQSEIAWPSGEALRRTATDFHLLCGLPGIVGAINGTQIPIAKPKFSSADYYYFKTGGYSMNCQAVVDSGKRFLNLYVGMPGSTNDARMLRRSSLYEKAQQNVLWDPRSSFSGFSPFLLGDAGYPLLPWLMVPHRRQGDLVMADALFNKRMCKGRVVVENAFALLKQSFKELQITSELNITLLPDVITCCALLHNVLLQQSHEDVELLLEVLHSESGAIDVDDEDVAAAEPQLAQDDDIAVASTSQK